VTIRQLSVLQWLGFLVGGGIWAAHLVAGYGLTESRCDRGAVATGTSLDALQGTIMGAAIFVILLAEAAAVTVLVRTRGVRYDEDEPPLSRVRFFAIAAVLANLLFLAIVILSGTATIVNEACRQS
jgi:hypothetical protein